MRGQTVKSPETIAYAKRRRAEGAKLREIGAELGVTLKTIHTWLTDPEGEALRARKERYGGTCIECGARTDGSRGRDAAPERCWDCWVASETQTVWTQARIIEAIREYARLHGRPPAATAWLQPIPIRGDTPPVSRVQKAFGSWNAAIAAAGFEPVRPGVRRKAA